MRSTAPKDPGAIQTNWEGRTAMFRSTHLVRRAAAVAALVLVPFAGAIQPAAAEGPAGRVYIQTNDPAGNELIAFARAANGALTREQTLETGGLGNAPTGLGSQGSIAITDDGSGLLVVNAGSDDVSLFDIGSDGLHLADVTSVGDLPVSVTVHGSIAYVLNQGADTIQGLRIVGDDLVGIPHSTANLSGRAVGGAQVAFSPNGRLLAVTEKATQTIDTYAVRPNARAVGPKVQHSSGATPFGFQFGPDGRLYVSEAPASAASSYDVATDGTLGVISASVPNNQLAACWLIVTSDGRFAYRANAGSANVSEYTIASNGALALVGTGAAGATDPGPVDLDVTNGDGFLFVLNSKTGSISGFSVNATDGWLTAVGGASGFAAGGAGLIAV
jgi:6-phosphogluconolactonase